MWPNQHDLDSSTPVYLETRTAQAALCREWKHHIAGLTGIDVEFLIINEKACVTMPEGTYPAESIRYIDDALMLIQKSVA